VALVLSILAMLAGGVAACFVASARRHLRQTTLLTAWGWALAFSLMGLALGTFDSVFAVLPRAWGEILWYLTAIIGLCPAVAVLGARRPIDRVWNVFVIVPLVAVLGWPAMTVLMEGWNPRVLHLEAPPLVAFGLVMVMGYGNYLGTRYGWCVALVAAGQVLLLAPLAGEVFARPSAASFIRPLGLICLSAGAILARVIASHPGVPADGFDCVWSDFQNSFGVVWARRIMDRFNQQSRHEQWPVRLQSGGFVWEGDSANRQHDYAQSEQFLRWLLRRFVDEKWIDVRGGPSQTSARESEPA
jgi:hypothetical protein